MGSGPALAHQRQHHYIFREALIMNSILTVACLSVFFIICCSFSLLSYQHEKIKFLRSYLADQQALNNILVEKNKYLQAEVTGFQLILAPKNVLSTPLGPTRIVRRVQDSNLTQDLDKSCQKLVDNLNKYLN